MFYRRIIALDEYRTVRMFAGCWAMHRGNENLLKKEVSSRFRTFKKIKALLLLEPLKKESCV